MATIVEKHSNRNQKIKSFSYFGSKHKLALPILKHLPPHNAWVEAFCGSAALTLAKQPAPIEIINDINNEIVNFFEQLRESSEELVRLIDLTPYAREELMISRTNGKPISNIERARRFLVSSMMSINGVFGAHKGGFSYSDSYVRAGMEARVSRWRSMPERLSRIAERLKHVRIEKLDARDLMRRYINRPATLVYLDPPYLGDRSKGYDFDQTDYKFHNELLQLANDAKCMIVVSSYENALYEKHLKKRYGWEKIKIKTETQGSNGERHQRTEILWKNKHCVRAKKAKTVPIQLTKREIKLGKLNPIRVPKKKKRKR